MIETHPKTATVGTVGGSLDVQFEQLFADALAEVGGKDYPELLRERITGPLSMTDTGVRLTKEQCDRLITGSGIGGPGPCADTDATAGSGGLYSTGNDMARWLRHQPRRQRPGGVAEAGAGSRRLSPAPSDDCGDRR